MSSRPLVSVVIPTYKRYELAKRAIQSARQQTYEPLQIVVVEDGSDSGIEQHVHKLHDPRLIFYRHATRRGLAAARNTGTKIAGGDYVAFLDDDDEWLPEKIALQVAVVESYPGDKCLVYCGASWRSAGQIVRERIPTARGPMANFIYNGYLLPPSSMLLSKDALLSVGGHSEELVGCIDHDLWIKLAHAGFDMDFVPKALVYANKDDHDVSRMTKRLDGRIKGIEQFFHKWKPVVITECGIDSWRIIENIYYQEIIHTIVRQYLGGIIAKQVALDYLRKLISLQSRPFLWADYIVFGMGRPHSIPLGNNVGNVARKMATYPFQRLGSWLRGRALSNCD